MNAARLIGTAVLVFAASVLQGGDLPADVTAKLLRVIVTSSKAGTIQCSDAGLRAALEGQGVPVDSHSPIVWASSAAEAKIAKMSGRLVVTGQRSLLGSAAILIEEAGGRPRIILNSANLTGSRVQLGDAILKVAEKI